MLMSRYYYMMSDFYLHADENTTSTMVENFAEQLDKLYDSGEANNTIVPIFIVRGGDESNPTCSLEPLYFIAIDGVPLIFSTCYRLSGETLKTIDSNADGGSFITEMLTYNNTHVYQLGAIDSVTSVDDALQQAMAGNLLESEQIDAAMLNTLLIQNEIEPIRKLELPNAGYVEVYALTGAEMDALQKDKNYNNPYGQTIVDYDNSEGVYYLVGLGGNPAIREVGVKCGSDGFMYTIWTNNSPKYINRAAVIADDFSIEAIENDLTDMTNAIGEHIIMHLRKKKLLETQETHAINGTI